MCLAQRQRGDDVHRGMYGDSSQVFLSLQLGIKSPHKISGGQGWFP